MFWDLRLFWPNFLFWLLRWNKRRWLRFGFRLLALPILAGGLEGCRHCRQRFTTLGCFGRFGGCLARLALPRFTRWRVLGWRLGLGNCLTRLAFLASGAGSLSRPLLLRRLNGLAQTQSKPPPLAVDA